MNKQNIKTGGYLLLASFLLLLLFVSLPAAEKSPQPAKADTVSAQSAKPDFATMSPVAQTEYFLKNRQSFADNPFRPLYHFSPPGFGLHDAAGMCWWKGKYHFFYLLSVPGLQWGRGHAVSDDLVHWQDLPMLPKEIHGGTGQVWVEKERVILSVRDSVATASDPMLLNWTKLPGKIPAGDNTLWHEGEYYYLAKTGRGDGPTLEMHRSKDMTKWESMGRYLEDVRFTDPGTDCSCPNILPLGSGKHLVLFFSHNQGPKYYLGTSDLQLGRFTIEKYGRMNYGPVFRGSLHAPSAFVDLQGRCVGMWNITECNLSDTFSGREGGVISLPRQLSMNDRSTTMNDKSSMVKTSFKYPDMNSLCIQPVEEMKTLRFNPVKLENVVIPANGEKVLSGIQGKAMELEAVIDPRNASEIGLHILRSPNGQEQTTIRLFMHAWAWPWKGGKRELMLDVSRASLNPDVPSRLPEIGPLYLEEGEPLRLHIFIDRSIIEVFANGRQCLTLRAYPTRQDSKGVSIFARGGEANLVSLAAYQMRSVWPELKEQEGR